MIISGLRDPSLAIFVKSRYYQIVVGENPLNPIFMRGEEI
jgi:hypothetical protein